MEARATEFPANVPDHRYAVIFEVEQRNDHDGGEDDDQSGWDGGHELLNNSMAASPAKPMIAVHPEVSSRCYGLAKLLEEGPVLAHDAGSLKV